MRNDWGETEGIERRIKVGSDAVCGMRGWARAAPAPTHALAHARDALPILHMMHTCTCTCRCTCTRMRGAVRATPAHTFSELCGVSERVKHLRLEREHLAAPDRVWIADVCRLPFDHCLLLLCQLGPAVNARDSSACRPRADLHREGGAWEGDPLSCTLRVAP